MHSHIGCIYLTFLHLIPLGEAKCQTPAADDDHDDDDDDGDDGIIDDLSVVQLYFWSYHGFLS